MTCNPAWPAIQRELGPGETAVDRPDLCLRVFKLMLDELKGEIFKGGVLGKTAAKVLCIEFQKRGLPHAHLMIILSA
jgi:hypothetical protein